MSNPTHTVRISVVGEYAHGGKQEANVSVQGDGDLDHMLHAFAAALVAAGFSHQVAQAVQALSIEIPE